MQFPNPTGYGAVVVIPAVLKEEEEKVIIAVEVAKAEVEAKGVVDDVVGHASMQKNGE